MKSGFGGSVNTVCFEQSTHLVGEGVSKVTAEGDAERESGFRVLQTGFLRADIQHYACQKLILKMLLTKTCDNKPAIRGLDCD